jgi:hypothetical protein
VEEEQVDEELVATHLDPELAPHERHASPEFQQRRLNPVHERLLAVAFRALLAWIQVLEDVGILDKSLASRIVTWPHISRDLVDDLGTPALVLLPVEDVTAN